MPKVHLLNHQPLWATGQEWYAYVLQFETNDTSAPDGATPDDGETTLGRTGVGDLTITFPAGKRPNRLIYGAASIIEDDVDMFAKVTGYTASTGVLTLTTYVNTAGTIAQADTNNKTVQVLAIFSRNSEAIT